MTDLKVTCSKLDTVGATLKGNKEQVNEEIVRSINDFYNQN